MIETLQEWLDFFRHEKTVGWVRAILFFGIGLLVLRFVSRALDRMTERSMSPQARMLLRKSVYYGGAFILLVSAMNQLGVKIAALLGAAGVFGVAIGFAAQTSLSNLISGIFLISEGAFEVGDVIQVDQTTGTVHSIDLLSVKLRTFDNKYVRLPNENLVKGVVTNITYFPIRRIDMDIRVAHKEDIGQVLEILKELANKNMYVLDEPEPLIVFNDFCESHLNIRLGLWIPKNQFSNLNQTMRRQIKERFDAEGIEIPLPHRTLYVGKTTDPFPVRMHDNHIPANSGDLSTGTT